MRNFKIVFTATAVTTAALSLLATPAFADDPHDRSMTPEAIARDHELTRGLNEGQLAYVRQRDFGYSQGWDAYRAYHADEDEVAYQQRQPADSRHDYMQARRDYDRAMADWRRDVAACRAGDYSRCAR